MFAAEQNYTNMRKIKTTSAVQGYYPRKVLENYGVLQKELAKKIGVSEMSIHCFVTGNPTVKNVKRMADVIGIDMSEFFTERKTYRTVGELKETLVESGWPDAVIFVEPDYISAVVGFSVDGRVIYKYDAMADYLVKHDGMTYEEACEFIDLNVIRGLPLMGDKPPIIMSE